MTEKKSWAVEPGLPLNGFLWNPLFAEFQEECSKSTPKTTVRVLLVRRRPPETSRAGKRPRDDDATRITRRECRGRGEKSFFRVTVTRHLSDHRTPHTPLAHTLLLEVCPPERARSPTQRRDLKIQSTLRKQNLIKMSFSLTRSLNESLFKTKFRSLAGF